MAKLRTRQVRRGSPFARQTFQLSQAAIAGSQADVKVDAVVPGFAFEIIGIQAYAKDQTAVFDYQVKVGTVSAMAGRVAGAAVADGGNTGNGVITVAAGASAKIGAYVLTCTAEASNAGTFKLVDPDGIEIADDIAVGVEHLTSGHLTVTIADGSQDWDIADFATVTVRGGATLADATRADAVVASTPAPVGAAADALNLHVTTVGSGDATDLKVRVTVIPQGVSA
jgi:hypothetical protein